MLKIYILMIQERLNKLSKRIASMRVRQGLSFENIAHDLSITPAAYRKIEIGETKLTVERLFQISEILKSSLPELLEIGNDVFQQTNNESTAIYQQKVENFYQESKEVYEKLLQSKDEQIALLKKLLDNKLL